MSHPGRQLPPLHQLLERTAVRSLARRVRRELLGRLAREVLEEERLFLGRGRGLRRRYGSDAPDRATLTRHLERRLTEEVDALLRPKLRSVVNASGVLLHTNLGRARLGERARAEVLRVADDPVALEVDLDTGRRGRRHDRIDRWLRLLTGAEAGLAVNNGAGALWLAVQALAPRRRAVISRGEQVAIGGSFRMPELLRSTTARVTEVGTTNRTHLGDYEAVLREGDVVVKVHPSNYRIEGFTEEARLADLSRLCRERGASLIYDAGSGCLADFGRFGLEGEETVTQVLEAGADVVTFSGDKLLGGPQAGLVAGERGRVEKMARHPLMRALRLDKLILAALEATLVDYAVPARRPELPLFSALALSRAELRRRARALLQRVEPHLPAGWSAEAGPAEGALGAGSFAERPLPGHEVRLRGPEEAATEGLHTLLRRGDPAVLTRIGGGVLRIDLRTLREEDLAPVADRIVHLIREGETP